MGFVQEPYGALCTRIREPDTPSLSLHSSPSSVLGSLGSCSPASPTNLAEPGASADAADREGNEVCEVAEGALGGKKNLTENSGLEGIVDEVSPAASPISDGDLERSEELTEEDSPCHNNNRDAGRDTKETPRYCLRRGDGEWSPWLPS